MARQTRQIVTLFQFLAGQQAKIIEELANLPRRPSRLPARHHPRHGWDHERPAE